MLCTMTSQSSLPLLPPRSPSWPSAGREALDEPLCPPTERDTSTKSLLLPFPAGETSVSREEGNRLAHQGSPAAGNRGRGRLSSEAYLSRLVQDGHPSLLEIEKIRLENKTENYCLGVAHKRAFHARGWKVSPLWKNKNGNSLLGNSWDYVNLWQKTGHSSQQCLSVVPVRGSRR